MLECNKANVKNLDLINVSWRQHNICTFVHLPSVLCYIWDQRPRSAKMHALRLRVADVYLLQNLRMCISLVRKYLIMTSMQLPSFFLLLSLPGNLETKEWTSTVDPSWCNDTAIMLIKMSPFSSLGSLLKNDSKIFPRRRRREITEHSKTWAEIRLKTDGTPLIKHHQYLMLCLISNVCCFFYYAVAFFTVSTHVWDNSEYVSNSMCTSKNILIIWGFTYVYSKW